MTTVALLHPGAMGSAVAAEIRRNGHTVLCCPAGRSARTRARAEELGLVTTDLPTALDRAAVVLSICPPVAAEDVAREVAWLGYTGVYVDANAVSPERARRIAAIAGSGGATAVDASIIGQPPGETSTARLYLSGPRLATRATARVVAGTRLQPVRLGDELGRASALKMAFASFQKASRTLAAVAHALADQHGVTDALLAEAERMPTRLLADRAYLPSVAARAWRWAPEMDEVARALDAAGLPAELAQATASVLTVWGCEKDEAAAPVARVLRQLHLHG
ncbi:3-hydroxyisobutyrate dehydrogenase [Streptoalloteichus tenebrarius]|uniref:3-hydroxyisobutyrate dehydrogenase n=1 Tax=Streptoalloteichus tenebrarius (strain ATCC 17920 / DSM 40477 / JCM 4838 / CBS 697.72 / NBRC 16177 / NCIMB 11028 / NRRL B-12390 / A12253. 1 / ISP 5477) TaxID=1933 RepID=A0ABT1HU48_STRSD|nr:NAD(P)-dependent oxidoreductase [Streptoalloteichus tenebrarius]MCP2259037.1 3-hydroxyisobutyrate dehydrogenase [Streptoalloteichus tenebrarius]BFE99638.1 NAD(P)-dependent oxidoreductase [Streptoalloteichus tenebrarius]